MFKKSSILTGLGLTNITLATIILIFSNLTNAADIWPAREYAMGPTEYVRIYVALRTANPELAVAAIATLRLAMIEEFGEEEQRNLVAAGNSIDLPSVDLPSVDNIPRGILKRYYSYLLIDAGLSQENLYKVSHLVYDFFESNDLDLDKFHTRYDEYFQKKQYSNARILSNSLCAYSIGAGREKIAREAIKKSLVALEAWPEARQDRSYEFTQNEWISENIPELIEIVRSARSVYERDKD